MTKKQTVVFDLETMKSITETAKQYQINLINSMAGFKRGEMAVFSAGRQTGKSMLTMPLMKQRYYDTILCKEIMMPMIVTQKNKYKFSRAKWYTANVWSLDDDREIIEAWCTETFGPQPQNPDAWTRWCINWTTIQFRDEQDYMLFKLKFA